MEVTLLAAVIVSALAFCFTNGFHDAANAIATSVSTRALTPRVALALAAVMNFVGAFLGTRVASTVADTIQITVSDTALTVVLAALLAAISWNLITWFFGMPSSSSHALIGGLVGAALVAAVQVHWQVILTRVVLPMLIAPIVAFTLASLLVRALQRALHRADPTKATSALRMAQTISAAAMALGHGLQDAQKTMGVIVLALIAGGELGAHHQGVPLWVIVASATTLSLGTLAGGWRIVRMLGRRLVELDSLRGFSAESTSALILYVSEYFFHAPISSTHTIGSAVAGVGMAKGHKAVRWPVAGSMVLTWVLTVPAAALLAAAVQLGLAGAFA